MNEVSDYWEQIVKINVWQQKRISLLVIKNLFGTLSNKRLAIFGFAFKANTNDTRESPSINISRNLLQEGAQLTFYDPKVKEEKILEEFNQAYNLDKLLVAQSAKIAAEGADAILILTGWDEFKNLNWESIYKVMRKPAWVFDARICLDKKYLKSIGFNVWTVGIS